MSGNIKEYIKYIARGISPLYDNDGIVVLNQKCIRNQKISLEESRIHNIHKKSVSEDKILQNFDVLINSTGVGTLGRVAQVKNIKDKITVDSHITIVRPNLEKINGEFFGYCIKVQEDFIETLGTGATGQTELSRDAILDNVVIPHYSKENQQKIAKILSNYDDLIENNNKRIKILEEMAQKIYKEWFVDFKYPGHETATFKDTELGKIPSDWEVKNLFDFVNVLYGYAFKSNLFTDKKDKIPVVRIRDIKNQKTNTYTSEVPDDKYYIKDKEILIGMDGEFHMCNWLGGRAYLNQRVAKLKPKDNQSYYYLFLLLQKPIKDLNIAIQGTTVAHLGDNHLRMLYFAIPNEQILEKFNFIVEKFLDEILNLTKKNKVLNEAKSLLLPRLMSGEIDVMDLEIN